MNSTDMTTVGMTVTSPAADLCAAFVIQTVGAIATPGAPCTGTGLPFAGTAVRVRELATAGGEFAPIGVLPVVQIDAQRRPATTTGYAEHTSSTPGDLPPEGPLS